MRVSYLNTLSNIKSSTKLTRVTFTLLNMMLKTKTEHRVLVGEIARLIQNLLNVNRIQRIFLFLLL